MLPETPNGTAAFRLGLSDRRTDVVATPLLPSESFQLPGIPAGPLVEADARLCDDVEGELDMNWVASDSVKYDEDPAEFDPDPVRPVKSD